VYFARHDAIVQVPKVFKVHVYYKTLINDESWYSPREDGQEQWDNTKWERVWNRNGKCCYLPAI